MHELMTFFFKNPPEKSTREKIFSKKNERVIYIKTGGDC